MGKVALLLGASGETGGEILKLLIASNVYSKVIIIVRREMAPGEGWEKVEQGVVDFDNLDQHRELFKGVDVAFCCLGYRGSVIYAVKLARFSPPDEPMRKVDHDYVVSAGKLLKEGGCKQFVLLSAWGANHKSALVYLEAKGKTEKDLADLGFDRLVVFRPNMLVNQREQAVMGERFIMWLANKTDASYSWSITNKMLAQAMVSEATEPKNEEGESRSKIDQPGENTCHEKILEHSDIVKIALSVMESSPQP